MKRIRHFQKKVDTRSKVAMIAYLENHCRYSTMNSWNNSTSYAHNVKIHKLPLTNEQQGKAYELLDCDYGFEAINDLCRDFDEAHDYEWQVGFNGRSGGYLVLYRGGYNKEKIFTFDRKDNDRDYADGYGWLDKEEAIKRGLYCKEIKRVFSWPGKDVDQHEDFQEWSIDQLRWRVKLIQEFDKLADDCLNELVYLTTNYDIVEETICVPKKIKVLKEKAA